MREGREGEGVGESVGVVGECVCVVFGGVVREEEEACVREGEGGGVCGGNVASCSESDRSWKTKWWCEGNEAKRRRGWWKE